MANEKLQGEDQYHSKNCLLEMPRSHAKMRLKSTLKRTLQWQELYQKVIH